MVDKKVTDKSSTKKKIVSKKASESTSTSVEKKLSAKKTSASSPAVKSSVVKAAAATTAATEKAAASKKSDIKSVAKKISAVDKTSADNVIKSRKSINDLKARANEAKQRAQEKILDKAYVSDKPTDPLERLANTFDSSAKRWEMVVYPSLFAFVLLAGYGFFLIYRLTHDIAVLSQSVTHMAVIVSDVMPRMSDDLTKMTGSVDNMTGNIEGMSGDIGGMTTEIGAMSNQMNSLTPMSRNIESMTNNMGSMNRSVYGMQRDMHGLNRTVSSGPFGMMNDMMPFSSQTNVPRRLTPPPVWPSYNPVPKNAYLHSQPARQGLANTRQQAKSKRGSVQDKTKAESIAKSVKPPKSIVDFKKKMLQKNIKNEKIEREMVKKEVIAPDAQPVSLKN